MAVNILQTHLLRPELLQQLLEFVEKDLEPVRQIGFRAPRQPDYPCFLEADRLGLHSDQAVAGDVQSRIDPDNPLRAAGSGHCLGL